MRAAQQWSVRGDAPVAVRIDGGCANRRCTPVNVQCDDGPHFALTGDHRLGTLGAAAVYQRDWRTGDVAQRAVDSRCPWWGSIDNHNLSCGSAGVSGRIRHINIQGMRAFAQRLSWPECPSAGAVCRDGPDKRSAIVYLDDRISARRPVNNRLRIVGGAPRLHRAKIRGNIIYYLADGRRCWQDSDQLNVPRRGVRGDVACGIRSRDGKGVRPVQQRGAWRKCPGPVAVHGSGSQDVQAVVNRDGGTRFPAAAQGWRWVVGRAVIADRPRYGTHIVIHLGNRRGCRGDGVNVDRKGGAWLADVTRGIRGGHRQAVQALADRGGWRKCPCTGSVCADCANQRAVVVDLHG